MVPHGFRHPRKDSDNKDADIEWEVYFSKVELYLTRWAPAKGDPARNMHHPKLRVYLFAILMFRTYLEPFGGMEEKHIR